MNTVVFEVRPWQTVQDETMFADVTGFVAVYVQDCERTGVPEQPVGEDEATVRDCVPFD